MASRSSHLPRRFPVGARGGVLIAIIIAGLWSFASLGLSPQNLLPGDGILPQPRDLRSLGEFLSHALSPAVTYESPFVPEGTPPLLLKALDGAHRTVTYAAMAMTLAVLLGLPLGFVASSAWWRPDPAQQLSTWSEILRRTSYVSARMLIAGMRSIHELLWAVILLAAMGYSNFTAVIALVIPYAGTLAKVFSEILDEAPQDSADTLRAAGLSRTQIFGFGLLPRAAPDMAAYTFYRFECCMRSSAILGFFGLETLGKFISSSWSENYYGEVWTYLYTLFLLVLVMEWWSGVLRRRIMG